MIVIETLPLTKEIWDIREPFWILFYSKRCGFDLTNTADGGYSHPTYGRLGKKNSPEHIQKCRLARKGKKINYTYSPKRVEGIRQYCERRKIENPNYSWGKHSRDSKLKISQANKGRKHSAEFCKKASERLKGKIPLHSQVSVIQLNFQNEKIERFCSLSEASRKTGISRTGISNCLSGRSQTSGGYKWIYEINDK